jgi:branched-subunit amino acid transport protein
MTRPWLVVLLAGAVTMAMKAAGPLLFRARELPSTASRIVTLLVPAVFAALIATQTFAHGREVRLDARALGLAVGAAAASLRAPPIAVLALAVCATAGLRALFPGGGS